MTVLHSIRNKTISITLLLTFTSGWLFINSAIAAVCLNSAVGDGIGFVPFFAEMGGEFQAKI